MDKTVIIMGGSGMLGSMLVSYLSSMPDLRLSATVRTKALAASCSEEFPGVDWRLFDATASDVHDALTVVDGNEWVINAIGIVKPLIKDDNAGDVERAVVVNSLFPFLLDHRARASGARVMQIATDCVYSGRKGGYAETDEHDSLDVYGKTKSLGEVQSPHVYNLRCSIVGPEPRGQKSLLNWFLGQPNHSAVSGYLNHVWNGVTTLHFAKLCHGIITGNPSIPSLQHIIPAGKVNKYELLQCFAEHFNRQDVDITPVEAPLGLDRTLATNNKALNLELWSSAGYIEPPSVPQMVAELAQYSHQFPRPRSKQTSIEAGR